MGKRRYFILTLVVLGVLLSSCDWRDEHAQPENPDKKDGIVIGVSVLDLTNPFYVQIANGIKKEVEKSNVKVVIEDPGSDVSKQVASVEGFIASGIDAIIITALDQKLLEPVLERAMLSGIKVVAQSTKVENCNIFITADEWDMGHTIGQGAGKWIREKLDGRAEVAILNYPRIIQIANREKGIRDGIEEFAPQAEIVAVHSAASPAEGREATLEILKNHPDVKAVVGINDAGALGALKAFEEMGITGEDIFIGGVDATPEALEKIKKGTLYRGTVDISPFNNGKIDADFAIKLIEGQIVPNKFSIPARLVTKDNINNF